MSKNVYFPSMKLLLVAVVIVFSCVIAEYTDRYDEVKLDEVLSNKRLLNGYMKCALDKGPCTPEGKELKCKCIPDVECLLWNNTLV